MKQTVLFILFAVLSLAHIAHAQDSVHAAFGQDRSYTLKKVDSELWQLSFESETASWSLPLLGTFKNFEMQPVDSGLVLFGRAEDAFLFEDLIIPRGAFALWLGLDGQIGKPVNIAIPRGDYEVRMSIQKSWLILDLFDGKDRYRNLVAINRVISADNSIIANNEDIGSNTEPSDDRPDSGDTSDTNQNIVNNEGTGSNPSGPLSDPPAEPSEES